MPAKTRRATATRSTRNTLLSAQPGIASFARSVKSSQRASTSLKRKLEETGDDGNIAVLDSTCHEKTIPAKRSKPTIREDAIIAIEKQEPTISTPLIARPAEYHDLIGLNSAFLSAVSLHFAHNGPSAPANLKELLPSIERIWKKRKVVTRDIQKLLHLQKETRGNVSKADATSTTPQFALTGYKAQFFLERADKAGAVGSASTALKEADLNQQFAENLEAYWEQTTQKPTGGVTGSDFHQNIPLDPIRNSKKTVKPTLAKGQRTLDQLIGTKPTPVGPEKSLEEKSASSLNSTATVDRRSGLMERIKNKSLRQSKLPPPLSKEEMLEKRAAGRIPEIANVLFLLTPSISSDDGMTKSITPAKKAYTMNNITQIIGDSMRTPIPQEEVEICLNLLSESALGKGWVSIVTTTGARSVVLKTGGQISLRAIQEKSACLSP